MGKTISSDDACEISGVISKVSGHLHNIINFDYTVVVPEWSKSSKFVTVVP